MTVVSITKTADSDQPRDEALVRRLQPLFREYFVGPSYQPPFALKRPGQGWSTVKNRTVTESAQLDHLMGRYALAPSGHDFTRRLSLDVDRHNGETLAYLHGLYDTARAVLPTVPLVVSSPRGGLHLHYLTSQDTWRNDLRAYAHKCLEPTGILGSASVEIYPRKNGLRAPLGPDSLLLSPETLEPVGDINDCLACLAETLETGAFDPLVLPPDFREPFRGNQQRSRERPGGAPVDDSDTGRLLSEGLFEPSQRNSAFMMLAYHFHVRCRYSEKRASDELWAWIQAKHNGFSKDYNANPEQVRQHAISVTRAEYAKRRKPYQKREKANLFTHLLRYGASRGTWEGGDLIVEVPSRTLKSWHWKYRPKLERMLGAGLIEKARNHSNRLQLCNAYRIPRAKVLVRVEGLI